MRCPDCRHPIATRRWLRMPDHLICYQCGVSLIRSSRAGVRDGLLVWLVLMLPATLLPLIGGFPGLLAALALAAVVLPMRPWQGLRYTLPDPARSELPAARMLESRGSATGEGNEIGPGPRH